MENVINAFYPLNEIHVIIWLFLMMVYGFSEVAVLVRNRRLIPKSKEKDFTLPMIMCSYWLAMGIAVIDAVKINHHWYTGISIFGILIILIGMILRILGLIKLGKGFSVKVERNEGQVLVTNGLYKVVRHPLYLATLLQITGTLLMLCSLWGCIGACICLYGVFLRIKKEEKFLSQQFENYTDYAKKSWKLIPFLY